jgi:hypothetical protein
MVPARDTAPDNDSVAFGNRFLDLGVSDKPLAGLDQHAQLQV